MDRTARTRQLGQDSQDRKAWKRELGQESHKDRRDSTARIGNRGRMAKIYDSKDRTVKKGPPGWNNHGG